MAQFIAQKARMASSCFIADRSYAIGRTSSAHSSIWFN
jgi:hypothetical protein